jgi:hypothetical protein
MRYLVERKKFESPLEEEFTIPAYRTSDVGSLLSVQHFMCTVTLNKRNRAAFRFTRARLSAVEGVEWLDVAQFTLPSCWCFTMNAGAD